MKVLLLSDPNSSHIIKWANSLSENGYQITILGLGKLTVTNYANNPNIQVKTINLNITKNNGVLLKLKYLIALPAVKKIIKNFKPDIVHAHYATSYGLLGALCGFHPFVLSLWGSDVFSFPKISILHKYFLKYILNKSDKLLSTSHVLKKEINLYTAKTIDVTPFGIDMEQFKPMHVDSLFDQGDIVIGTVKALEEKYGIEYLIRAFKLISDKHSDLPLKLLITGGGSLEQELKLLVKELKIWKQTIFTGMIPYNDVPKFQNMLSIYVAVSNSESFGVAVIEACACSKPVIVSNVGGLPEIVDNKVTGFIVSSENPEETANAIEKLALNKSLREKMGNAGRKRVATYFNWKESVELMIEIYINLAGNQ